MVQPADGEEPRYEYPMGADYEAGELDRGRLSKLKDPPFVRIWEAEFFYPPNVLFLDSEAVKVYEEVDVRVLDNPSSTREVKLFSVADRKVLDTESRFSTDGTANYFFHFRLHLGGYFFEVFFWHRLTASHSFHGFVDYSLIMEGPGK